jgi:hypothetical protein
MCELPLKGQFAEESGPEEKMSHAANFHTMGCWLRPVAEESGDQAYRYSVLNMMPSFFSLLS